MTELYDGRLKKSGDTAREDRQLQDRAATEKRELSDDDRLEMFRAQFFNAALPDLPQIDGYHVCWLTTSNPRDSIVGRLRLGYELIKASDIPGYETISVKTGEYVGCVGVNEMVAAKLPNSLYQRYMNEAHHAAPAREDEKLAETARTIRQQAQQLGADVAVGEGLEELQIQRPAPVFG